MRMSRWWLLCLLGSCVVLAEPGARPPGDQSERDFWVANMVRHGFTVAEMEAASGLAGPEIAVGLRALTPSPVAKREILEVWPYPGGRHPRLGFLDGAIDPQRETKVSVFMPWDRASYVVMDVPEALWSNLGLTYLAHTHVPTVWSQNEVGLPAYEWERLPNGELMMSRTLPNRLSFGSWVQPQKDHVAMVMWLHNGTRKVLSDLRVQNCVMLKGAPGFSGLTNDNKTIRKPFVACESEAGGKWVITAWEPCDRPWANAPVPCLHSDPKFPDTKPDEWQVLNGWLSFYEGDDVEAEFARIEKAWAKKSLKEVQAALTR